MNFNFSAPSKTFLAGEYAVLNGGPALVLCTQPKFTFSAQSGSGRLTGIPEGSPAWTWLEKHKTLWRDWDLHFQDPHSGRGGFGASGAQFLFAHALVALMGASVRQAVDGLDLQALLRDYRAISGGRASGADIVALATGRVTRVMEGMGGEQTPWPYPELEFAVVRTGQKMPTHEHLAGLNLEELKVLNASASQVAEAFGARSSSDFMSELRTFAKMLRALGLQATKPLLEEIEKEPWCIASKGCGALGADTLLVFFAPADLLVVQNYFKARGMDLVATTKDLASGIEMQWSRT